jgi:pimeloyl-ACP methyl ester carboxylesterase
LASRSLMRQLRSQSGLRCLSQGAGPAVVLLHPVAMRAEFWTAVAARLAGTHHVLAFDTPQHGESRRAPSAYWLDEASNEVLAALAEFGVAQAAFVGCSMGAMLATGAALAKPAAATAVVVANGGLGMDDQGRAAMRQRAQAARVDFAATVEPTLERWFSPTFRESHPKTVDMVRSWLSTNDPEVVARAWEAIAGLDYQRRLGDLRVPLLAIAGELDGAAPPAAMTRIAQAAANGRYVELKGAGHFAPIEQPDAFARHITEFLDGLAQSSPVSAAARP